MPFMMGAEDAGLPCRRAAVESVGLVRSGVGSKLKLLRGKVQTRRTTVTGLCGGTSKHAAAA